MRSRGRVRHRGAGALGSAYGGSLDVATYGKPIALGGRGDVVGSFNNAGSLFLAAHYNWKS